MPDISVNLLEYPLYITTGDRNVELNYTDPGHTIRFASDSVTTGSIKLIGPSVSSPTVRTYRYKSTFDIIFSVNFYPPEIWLNNSIKLTDLHNNLIATNVKYSEYILSGGQHLIPDEIEGVIIKINRKTMTVAFDLDFPIKANNFIIDKLEDFLFTVNYIDSVETAMSSKMNSYIDVKIENLNLLSGFTKNVEVLYRPYKSVGSYVSLGLHEIEAKSIFKQMLSDSQINRWSFSETPVNVPVTPISDYWTDFNIECMQSDKWSGKPKFNLIDINISGNITSEDTFDFNKDVVYKLSTEIFSHSLPANIKIFADAVGIETYPPILNNQIVDKSLLGEIILNDSNESKNDFYFKPINQNVNCKIIIELFEKSGAVTIKNFEITPDYEYGFNPTESNIVIPIDSFKTDLEFEFKFNFSNQSIISNDHIILEGVRFDSVPPIIDKDYIGLENVDNTSDQDKPVSTATQTELDTKYNASNPSGFETPTQLNTRDTDNRARANHTGTQTISTVTNLQTELDTKLTNSTNTISSVSTLPVNFNYNFINITTQAEALTLSNGIYITGPNNKEITIMISDDGVTSQTISYSANWICINGSFPATTDKKVTIIKAIKHQDGNIYCRAYQS